MHIWFGRCIVKKKNNRIFFIVFYCIGVCYPYCIISIFRLTASIYVAGLHTWHSWLLAGAHCLWICFKSEIKYNCPLGRVISDDAEALWALPSKNAVLVWASYTDAIVPAYFSSRVTVIYLCQNRRRLRDRSRSLELEFHFVNIYLKR